MDTQGRVALVTGSAHRVGKAIAIGLAERGVDIAVHHHRSTDAATSTAAELRDLGVRAHPIAADLRETAQVAKLFEDVEATFGGLDILVNSAAVFERSDALAIAADDWDRLMSLNLRAPFLCSQHAARSMRARGRQGRIINIADVAAFEAWPGYAHYCVSKAGLVALTRVLARAFAPDILVNAVAPGTVLPPEGTDKEERAELAGMSALGRIGDPDDIARAVVFLVESDYVTGETIVVDGGMMLRS